MKLSRLDLNETLGADNERGHMIERIINLTLDILYLLTGEDFIVLKMSYGRVTHSSSPCISGGFGRTPTAKLSPPSLTPERSNDKRILEVTQKITELLTGEEGRRSIKEMRLASKSIKQENDDDDVLQSEDESRNRNPPERCPRPLYSPDRKEEELDNTRKATGRTQREISQNTVTFCLKKEMNATGQTSVTRKRGTPRKRRNLQRTCPQSPLGSEDIDVIMEDFQDEAKEVISMDSDQENEDEDVTNDLNTGWSQDKLSSVSEMGRNENDGEEISKLICKGKRWRPPKKTLLSIATEDEEENGESAIKDSDWEISADGSLHSIASIGPGPPQDDSSEDTIIKVSLDDVQESAEPTKVAGRGLCRNGNKITFTCLDCGRCFESSRQLESHHKVHTGEAPFSCSACGSSFPSSEELGEHVQLHTSEKLFACSQCGKCFTIKANLIAHRRVHTGDKPFACAECGRRFTLRSSLETHLPVHTMEKPYPCALCGKCFTTSGRLAVHQTTHAGDKTYECEDCGKIFTTSSSMNRHRRTHTGEKPYSCTVCGKCFNRETNLYRHQMIHTR